MSELVTGITPLIVIWCSLALLTIGLVVPIFLLYQRCETLKKELEAINRRGQQQDSKG